MSEQAEIILEGKSHKLPIVVGTENEKAIDINNLLSETCYITLYSGSKNTGATVSAITFVDGEEGILSYRGYPIEQLAERSDFIEVAYLLIKGELPTKQQLDEFYEAITMHTLIHEDIRKFYGAFPTFAHPMGVVSSVTSALSTFYPESLNPHRGEEKIFLTITRLLAKFPTIAAWAYKHSIGHPVVYPKNKLGYVENFLNMMFSMPTDEYEIDPVVVNALDKLLILHADHEQNCSTSTVRLAGSSQANLYSSIAAGITALWGPLHGGANQEVIEMLDRIREDGGSVDKWIAKAKDKNDPFRLMGFGHRVYKNFDPRAKIIKKACDDVLNRLGIKDPVLEIAKKLEEVALNDEYFVERKLYPNVDFYSGIIYRAMGIPKDMFTVLFAVGRLPGWIAQWKEMTVNKEPIGRPRQIYVGSKSRDYINIADR
ncbi:MAG: citrate synthase [Flavobacteriales bacterium]|nr:citrate synthase [Flavobacteriales bacterium]